MNIPKSDLKIETMRGTGPGGQHRNKTDSAVRITHKPTGITAYADERSQSHSKKAAMAQLREKLLAIKSDQKASEKKERRDEAIKPQAAIRTYDFKSGVVRDHRTGKKASIKDVLVKGKLELLR